jgi:hypothetical protein
MYRTVSFLTLATVLGTSFGLTRSGVEGEESRRWMCSLSALSAAIFVLMVGVPEIRSLLRERRSDAPPEIGGTPAAATGAPSTQCRRNGYQRKTRFPVRRW